MACSDHDAVVPAASTELVLSTLVLFAHQFIPCHGMDIAYHDLRRQCATTEDLISYFAAGLLFADGTRKTPP
jgi:hypothetical protein